nr:hypothetical protein [Tanacetum cinerariifolium]
DHSAGPSTFDISMREFKDCVEDIEVSDVNHSGLRFTWNEKPHGDVGTLKIIDRVMTNLEFNDVYTGSHAIFQPYRISNHSPTVLKVPMVSPIRPKAFKFPNMLVHDVRFHDIVRDGWSRHVSGICMFQVVKKLKFLKKPLRKLLYEKGNLYLNVKRLQIELDRVQTDLDLDPFNLNLREEEACYVKAFNDALLMEEQFLQQKSKIDLLKAGDSNSAYFHKVVKGRISRSRIDAVTCSDGSQLEGDQVAATFVAHYTSFLGQQGVLHLLNTNDLFINKLDSNVALNMDKIVTPQEVKEAIFSMGNNKSSGPDGHDRWDYSNPLSDIVSSRDIHRAGLTMSTMIKESICNGQWRWPSEWSVKYPLLAVINVPSIMPNVGDSLEWRVLGISKPFSAMTVWDSPRGDEVWNYMNVFAGLPTMSSSLNAIVDAIIARLKRRSASGTIHTQHRQQGSNAIPGQHDTISPYVFCAMTPQDSINGVWNIDTGDFRTRRVLLRCDITGDLYPVTAPSPIPHVFLEKPPVLCHACQLGKHVRLLFVSSNTVVTSCFDIIHLDVWTSPYRVFQ